GVHRFGECADRPRAEADILTRPASAPFTGSKGSGRFRSISIRVVEEVDHAHARPELRRVWDARGDEVFLTRMVRPRLAADRQHEVTRDDEIGRASCREGGRAPGWGE